MYGQQHQYQPQYQSGPISPNPYGVGASNSQQQQQQQQQQPGSSPRTPRSSVPIDTSSHTLQHQINSSPHLPSLYDTQQQQQGNLNSPHANNASIGSNPNTAKQPHTARFHPYGHNPASSGGSTSSQQGLYTHQPQGSPSNQSYHTNHSRHSSSHTSLGSGSIASIQTGSPASSNYSFNQPPYMTQAQPQQQAVQPPQAAPAPTAVLGVDAQPSLMRTSQLNSGPSIEPVVSAPVMSAGPSGMTAAPFTGYVATMSNKANLELQGDLNSMAVGWTHDEWINRRRLVQFWRRQEGSTIHAAFRPTNQADYIPNSIVISCIYREEKNECFVTSVDAIYLLEALVGVRFTVEEKNRIRRNLEGFRPITVSKSKAGSEDFFKLIMGFPNPKPRNIEKDVKVFPWKIFGSALKKIIGKYSASYTMPAPYGMIPTAIPPPLTMSGGHQHHPSDESTSSRGGQQQIQQTPYSPYQPNQQPHQLNPMISASGSSQGGLMQPPPMPQQQQQQSQPQSMQGGDPYSIPS